MRECQKWTKETKENAVKDFVQTGNAAAVSKKYGTTPKTLYNWKWALQAHAKSVPQNDLKQLKKQLEDKELENQILRELLKKTYQVMPID